MIDEPDGFGQKFNATCDRFAATVIVRPSVAFLPIASTIDVEYVCEPLRSILAHVRANPCDVSSETFARVLAQTQAYGRALKLTLRVWPYLSEWYADEVIRLVDMRREFWRVAHDWYVASEKLDRESRSCAKIRRRRGR